MKINPKSEEELQALNLIAPGVYNFQVIDAHDKISKKGSEMIELKLCVWDSNGSERVLFDYLLDAMPHKLRHFAEITGLIDKYNLGNIVADDCFNKAGKVELIIQVGGVNPMGGKYPDKNSVKDYVKGNFSEPLPKPPVANDFVDDDLPF